MGRVKRNEINKLYIKYKEKREKLERVYINRNIINSLRKIAIIVPYRDNLEQDRKSQLIKFKSHIKKFLDGHNYKLYIIEQSQDGCKFNRGKLLNVGMEMAIKDGCEMLITHDVDLLPQKDMLPYYLMHSDYPVHLGDRWKDKYSYSRFIGGVLSMSSVIAEKSNGYPNNFWGWGGEDDALYNRLLTVTDKLYCPENGTYVELKHVHTGEIKKYVNMQKKKNILSDLVYWKNHGLKNLKYKLISNNNDVYTVEI